MAHFLRLHGDGYWPSVSLWAPLQTRYAMCIYCTSLCIFSSNFAYILPIPANVRYRNCWDTMSDVNLKNKGANDLGAQIKGAPSLLWDKRSWKVKSMHWIIWWQVLAYRKAQIWNGQAQLGQFCQQRLMPKVRSATNFDQLRGYNWLLVLTACVAVTFCQMLLFDCLHTYQFLMYK